MSGFIELLFVLALAVALWRALPYLLRGAEAFAGLAGEGAPALLVLVMLLVTVLVGLMALALVARSLQ